MKVILEGYINSAQDENYAERLEEFNLIMFTLNGVGKMEWAKEALRNKKLKHFIWGSGSSHIWISNSKDKKRILIITEN